MHLCVPQNMDECYNRDHSIKTLVRYTFHFILDHEFLHNKIFKKKTGNFFPEFSLGCLRNEKVQKINLTQHTRYLHKTLQCSINLFEL